MNAKQRRKKRRKFPHIVTLPRPTIRAQIWLKEQLQGESTRLEWNVYSFTHEEDAVMFALKFSGQQ